MILQLHDLAFYGAMALAVVRSHKIRIVAWGLAGSGSAFSGMFTNVAHKEVHNCEYKNVQHVFRSSHLDRLFAVERVNFQAVWSIASCMFSRICTAGSSDAEIEL